MSWGRTAAAAELCHRPEEAHDEVVDRLVVQLVGRADLLDGTVVDHDDLVGHLHRFFLIVGDEDGGDVHLVVQASQPVAQLLADLRVERAERLVEQHDLWLDGERASQRHALTLPTRQLRGIPIGELAEMHEREQFVDPRLDLFLRSLADLEPERDVAAHGHVLERGVVLEDEADVALLRRQRRRVFAGDLDRAGVGLFETGDDAQQGRLAAAARTEQGGERTRWGCRPRRRSRRRSRRSA